MAKFRCEKIKITKKLGSYWTGETIKTIPPRQCVFEQGHHGDCNFSERPLIKPPMRNPYPTWHEEK